ncbi:class C sortase [Alloscardovia criceti]|uniref:class C sortase n=1 Tax=Alloscardovia criceti TaxID=356828 RepID=UPI00036B2A10|nr:class C sortase [Alloscardovia criceti]
MPTTTTPSSPAQDAQPAQKRPWKLTLTGLIPAVSAIIGVLLFLYPNVAAWFSQYNQSQVITGYNQQVKNVQPDAATQIREAKAYNAALTSGAIYNALSNIPIGSGAASDSDLEYNKLLNVNDSGLMARLQIPSIDLDLPIYHGTSDVVLEEGLGHLEGTSLPVGGVGTRTVITGHRGLANALMFTNLDKVKEGDTFTFEVLDQVLTYKVTNIKVIDPDQTEELRADPSKDLATLVTCTPLGINTQRILVTGERIEPTPASDVQRAQENPAIPRFPWWAVWIALTFILAGVYVWRTGYQPVAQPAQKQNSAAAPVVNDADNEQSAELADKLEELSDDSAGSVESPQ